VLSCTFSGEEASGQVWWMTRARSRLLQTHQQKQ